MAITYKFVLNTVAKGKPQNVARLVMLRIISQRVIKFVDTSVYARPDQFNEDGDAQKKNWIRKNHPAHELSNQTLKVWHDRITALVHKLTQMGGDYTAQQVKDRLLGRQDESLSGHIEAQIEAWQVNHQEDNARNHQSMLNRLREFLYGYNTPKRRRGEVAAPDASRPTVELNQLSPHVVLELEKWLMQRNPLQTNRRTNAATRRNYATDMLRRLRQHVQSYIVQHRLPSEADPTRGMTFTTIETDPVWLTQEELIKWEQARLDTVHIVRNGHRGPFNKGRRTLEAARVFYLSSYYLHGIRAGDLLSLRVQQVETRWEIQQGKARPVTRLLYTSDKKDKTKSVLVEPFLLEMLQPYLTDKEPHQFVFPFLPDALVTLSEEKLGYEINKRVSYVNKLLKQIAGELDTNPLIAMHSARRTFADELYELTGDLRVVQDALHHSDIQTTQRYVRRGKQARVDTANQVYARHRTTETPLKQNEEDEGKEPSSSEQQSA